MRTKSYLHIRIVDGFVFGKRSSTASPIANPGCQFIEISSDLASRELLFVDGEVIIDTKKEKEIKDREKLFDELEKKVDKLEPLTEEEARFYDKWKEEK